MHSIAFRMQYRDSFYRWQRRWHSLRVSRSPAVWSNGPVLGGLSFAVLHSARHCELARRFSGDCVCAHASSSNEIVSAVRGTMAETLAPTIRHAISPRRPIIPIRAPPIRGARTTCTEAC